MRLACVTGAPHSLQNLEFGGSSVPHDPHNSPVAVSPPPPSPLGSIAALVIASSWNRARVSAMANEACVAPRLSAARTTTPLGRSR